jgi:hypothetical protein
VKVLLATVRAYEELETAIDQVTLAALQELLHLPEEEGEQERPDVASVDVGIGHENDLG